MPVLEMCNAAFGERSDASRTAIGPACGNFRQEPGQGQLAVRQSQFVGRRIAGSAMTELVAPMLPLLAIMFGVLLFVTYVPESFMWLPRWFGFAR